VEIELVEIAKVDEALMRTKGALRRPLVCVAVGCRRLAREQALWRGNGCRIASVYSRESAIEALRAKVGANDEARRYLAAAGAQRRASGTDFALP
jgi:hypothetical protein